VCGAAAGGWQATAAALRQLYSRAAGRRRQAALQLQQQLGLGPEDLELLEAAQQDPFRGLVGGGAAAGRGEGGPRAGARAFSIQVGCGRGGGEGIARCGAAGAAAARLLCGRARQPQDCEQGAVLGQGRRQALHLAPPATAATAQDLHNLLHILHSPGLAPELRRSAAEQLAGLAADQRFTGVLGQPAELDRVRRAPLGLLGPVGAAPPLPGPPAAFPPPPLPPLA
jgi:hypothetical protein